MSETTMMEKEETAAQCPGGETRSVQWHVLVTHTRLADSAIALLSQGGAEVHFSPPYDPPEVVAERAAKFAIDGLIVRQGQINDTVIGASPRLKVIAKHGSGVDNIDIAAAERRGIPVYRGVATNARAVAEHAIALMLAALKDIVPLDQAVKGGAWPKPTYIGRDFSGATLGLIGFGAIARQVGAMAQALGMVVAAYDPHLADDVSASGVTIESDLDVLLARSDVVSVHCPLTDGTRDLLDGERLAHMKPTAFLVNTARGGIVNEAALVAALQAGTIAGAALDNFASEPPAADNPLLGLSNVIVTPHIGGVTAGSARTMAETAARQVLAVLRGETPDPKGRADTGALSLTQ
jgi:D-3-phosphoglycerate dehydrogenase